MIQPLIMSILKSSKTWPSILTMAVVQLRLDSKGRTYSSIANSPNNCLVKRETINNNGNINNNNNNNVNIINNNNNNNTNSNINSNHQNKINNNVNHINTNGGDIKSDSENNNSIVIINNASDQNVSELPVEVSCSTISKIPDLQIVIHDSNNDVSDEVDNQSVTNNINYNNNDIIQLNVPNGGKFCYCNCNGSTKAKVKRKKREKRSESIKVDNWEYIYTEKQPINQALPLNGKIKTSSLVEHNYNEHGCLSGLGALKAGTLTRHYYPESSWGWVIVTVGTISIILNHGLQLAAPLFLLPAGKRFKEDAVNSTAIHADPGGKNRWAHVDASVDLAGPDAAEHMEEMSGIRWLGALSTAVALFISPITIAVCKRKSTRLTAVIGGLVTALGCLFTSFASQFHQLFFSYGAVVGVGVGMTRDCSTLMVAQYFKRRREFVEIFIVSGSGLGIAIMSAFIKTAIDAIGWRLGLQAVTGTVFITFILGTCYRSASLYHPQRRAILHLKNQKRKIKDKNKLDDRPPFFDFSTLKSKTVRILLVSTGISAFGINTPIFYLAHQVELDGIGDKALLLQAYLGLAWTLGCAAFGLLVVRNSVECRIARQYLCQTAIFMCGICILALTAVHGSYHGYVMFVWIYGIFCGGYHYSLKMYTYEKVRARNFAHAWGFVQFSQSIPIALGVPISGYMNIGGSGKAGYYFSSTCVLIGSLVLFLIDLHRRNVSRHKHTQPNGTTQFCVSETCPQRRKLSFSQEPDNEPGIIPGATALMLGSELLVPQISDGIAEPIIGMDKPELTCISEEGIADMDLPDNLLDDLDYVGDCITSCNKVENYLMLSEFENNLDAEVPILIDRRGRRVSISKTKNILNCHGLQETIKEIAEEDGHHCPNHLHPNSRANLNHKSNNSHSNSNCNNLHCPANANANSNSSNNHHQQQPPQSQQQQNLHNNHHNKWRPPPNTFLNNRMISVIDEASV